MRLDYIIISFLVSSFFYGCGSKQTTNKIVFRYNESSGITSLDPAFAKFKANIWAVNHLFNGLVQLDEELTIQPAIAKSWNISDDGMTYTFDLRTDVFFHDHEAFGDAATRKVVAKDFVYSFNRMIDPDLASPGAWLFHGEVTEVDPFTAINDSTFQIALSKAFYPFLGVLTMQYCSVVPHELVKKYGKDFRAHPIGTGPFKLGIWAEGEKLTLLKNERYFEMENGVQLPYLDAIEISFIEDKQMEYLHFRKGDFDFLSGIDGSYKDKIITKDGSLHPDMVGTIKMLKKPYLHTEYLGFLIEPGNEHPLQNPLVRRAINFGFDRKKVIRYLRNNVGVPADGGFVPSFIYPESSKSKVQGFTYDPQKAAQLLSEAGFENGVGLPQLTIKTNGTYVDLCTFIQKQLSEIGIRIKLDVLTTPNLLDQVSESKAEFFRASWIADYPDPESFLTVFYSQNPAPPNYTRFNDADFDNLYIKALAEPDEQIRMSLYQQMDSIIIMKAPVVPIYYDQVVRFIHNNIEGLGINPMNLLSVKKVKKSVEQ